MPRCGSSRCAPAPSAPWPHPPAHCAPSLGRWTWRSSSGIPFTGRFTALTAPWRPSGPRRSATDGVYYASINMKNASNPQQYSMGNASLQGSARQDHPSDGSGDRGRSEHLRIKSNAPGFSHPAGRQRGHRCQGCPQNGARCQRGRQSIWCTSSASSRPSARSRRRRSPEPLLAKYKASGIFSSSFCSVSLLYWSHTKKHTAEVLPFSAGKS